jgi:2,4-dienoyl-CoA reductase-like NADH-dependent reductase (Old Yellow Enzyme family)/thioredoxin reductase
MPFFKHLFSPIKLGTMEVKNRLVMPPMSVNFGVDEDGFVTEQHWAYLSARAAHGTGMITVGGGAVHPSGLDLPKMPPIWDDKYIPALAKMTEIIHQNDVRFGMQLLHGGRQAFHGERVAPSPLPALGVVKGLPRELTGVEIEELIAAHGDAARRCQQAGFDFVEIHGAHGYLIAEFLAPLSNKRTDEYGGPFENRVRFLIEILRNIKSKTGPDFPVGVRINGRDYIKDGWELEECLKITPLLEAEGADWLHISAGIYGSFPITIPSMYADYGCFVPLAEAVKGVASIPVIAVGRIKDPALADRIIAEGRADLVAMGRAHLADPELAAKARTGNVEDIRPCIGCCLGCIDRALALEESTCVMNPEMSREYLLGELKPTEQPRRIMVVGAGPGGLAVARLAAMRGNDVVVVEEKGRIGGLLGPAAQAPGRGELMELIEYYRRELDRLKVEIRLDTGVTRALIDDLDPEAVVIATGSLPALPQIEGLYDTEMVLHTALDVLSGEASPGKRIIVLGGGVAALTTADYLAEPGREVVVLNRFSHYAPEISANDRTYLRERLKRPEVRLYKNVVIEEFRPDGVVFKSVDERVELAGFSDLVISEEHKAVRAAADLFRGRKVEIHTIGDAKSPRTLLDSQTEADELGRSI